MIINNLNNDELNMYITGIGVPMSKTVINLRLACFGEARMALDTSQFVEHV